MESLLIFIVVAIIALILKLKKISNKIIWPVGLCILPAAVFLQEFVLPYQGGGASMWPIALFVGTIISIVSIAVGIGVAEHVQSKKP